MVLGLGILLLVIGVPTAVWPYEIARFEEQLDSIGSKRSWSDVEPADWKVALNKYLGIGMAGFGALFVIGGLL
ncbi:hypothetical protein [Halovivax limisalsi]|uniref:hypothetical protein n=1 Tax=Halovivax limisalsi TaxID=1453760 RepID=UPI001FFD653D|nr:hypothetical protein [Halovivax limisalsi]